MIDYKFWLPIALSLAAPAVGVYTTIKIMDVRVSHLEKTSDAEEWGELKATVKGMQADIADLESSKKALWQAIGRLRD